MTKKKNLSLFLILFLATTIFTGCSKQQTQTTNQVNNQSGAQMPERRMPDFGQPETDPQVTGIVSNMIGNEITILKIERPEPGEGGEGMPGFGMNANSENNEVNTENKALQLGGTQMGGRPGGGFMRGGTRPDMDEDAQAQMLERIKEMSTGEETVIIPVGIRMLKPDTEAESREPTMVEASLEDIEENKMIQIWLDESITDRNVASFVLIMR